MKKLDIEFKAFPSTPALKKGLVFRLVNEDGDGEQFNYFRITHVFNETDRLYFLEISTPDKVSFAKRPKSIPISVLNKLFEQNSKNILGNVPLPLEFIKTNVDEDLKLSNQEIADNNYKLLMPLLEIFEDETFLQSRNFEPTIVKHATQIEMSRVGNHPLC